MKKIISFLILFFSTSFSFIAFSQDIIVKMNGEELEAKILEVNTTEIKYKKHSLPDGPLFIIQKSEVHIIRYSNGESELINKKPDPSNKISPDTSQNSKKDKVTTVKVTYSSLGKEKDVPDYWAAIKLNPLLAVIGEYPVYFEYSLTKKTSIEAGLGITYPNELMRGVFEAGYLSFEDRKKNIGFTVSANYRLYPSYVFDEFYFGFDFRYKSYVTEVTNCGSTSYQNKKESFNTLDLKLLIGYTTEIGSSALFEYFVGFGLRNMVWDYYGCNQSSGSELYIIKEQNMIPCFTMGIKIGLGLELETDTSQK